MWDLEAEMAKLQVGFDNNNSWLDLNIVIEGDWSKTGGAGEAQPDNREFKVEGKHDEACIAMLNNFYADGAVWHDIACYHKKWFVCEDSDSLMDFARTTSPEHAPRI